MKSGPKPRRIYKITATYLRKILCYEPTTGIWIWLISPSGRIKIGEVAGSAGGRYYHIQLFRKKYKSHRLAWLYITGRWPKAEIDHINGKPRDNRWRNLREASRSENMANAKKAKRNTTGLKGATRHKRDSIYEAWIRVRKQNFYLGRFETAKLAHTAYILAAKKYFGEFARAR
jgi:hypothetical protein